MHRATVVSACTILLLVSTCIAQQTSTTAIPNLIRYVGTLKDPQGTPLASSTAGVTFAIYGQQDGGVPIWMETQNITTDNRGNYSVLLGSTTAAGLPSDLFSEQERRWLGVQVQGEAEQARVFLVSVPYAFRASEAEKLAGHSGSEFVTTNMVQKIVQQQLQQQGTNITTLNAQSTSSTEAPASGVRPTDPATNFVDSTTDQVVGVTQSGSGKAINATAVQGNAIVGNSTATTGSAAGVEGLSSAPTGFGIMGQNTATTGSSYGVSGLAASTMGIGVQGNASAASGATYGVLGYSYSSSGTGIRAGAVAATGSTYGLQAWVNSPTGTAALFQNFSTSTVTGKLLVAKTMATGAQFVVDGGANVTTTGSFTGNGAGLTGIPFSQLAGQLGSSQLSGTYSNALTFSNTGNVFYGNGANLAGVLPAAGSPYYIQNGGAQQSASFNITGSGTLGGTLAANVVESLIGYEISGEGVLNIGSPGDDNVFLGVGAGASNVTGQGGRNVFSGFQAGYANTTGSDNIFTGYRAGYANTTGTANVFTGSGAGYHTTGSWNVFTGEQAGFENTTGSYNVFTGPDAGYANTTGSGNIFTGSNAGLANTTGSVNIFIGGGNGNTTGSGNVFIGGGDYNTTGSGNLFLGDYSGSNSVLGNNDIYIGSPGCGSAPCNENNTMRLGSSDSSGITATYIAGIDGSTVGSSGTAVFVDNNGQLGTVVSSRRFKEQINDMGDSTDALMNLRPVTFLYKPEYSRGDRTLQYGLIAEEVAKVYPELVAYDKDGQPYTVRYQYLAPMLLNEVQRQYRRAEAQAEVIEVQQGRIAEQQDQIASQQREIAAQSEQIETFKLQLQLQNASLQQRLERLEKLVQSQPRTVAMQEVR